MKKKPFVEGRRFYLGGKRKPFVQGQKFYLGGKRKQKGGFLLGPGLGLGIKLIKKVLGGNVKEKREEDGEKQHSPS